MPVYINGKKYVGAYQNGKKVNGVINGNKIFQYNEIPVPKKFTGFIVKLVNTINNHFIKNINFPLPKGTSYDDAPILFVGELKNTLQNMKVMVDQGKSIKNLSKNPNWSKIEQNSSSNPVPSGTVVILTIYIYITQPTWVGQTGPINFNTFNENSVFFKKIKTRLKLNNINFTDIIQHMKFKYGLISVNEFINLLKDNTNKISNVMKPKVGSLYFNFSLFLLEFTRIIDIPYSLYKFYHLPINEDEEENGLKLNSKGDNVYIMVQPNMNFILTSDPNDF